MAIKLINITKKFDNKVVFKDFNAHINTGKTTCIMGASGSGKTTMLRIMMGLMTPDNGQIEGLVEFKKSAIFQEDRLCENLTVTTNIKMVLQQPLAKVAVLKAIQKVGLPPDCLEQSVQQLSGGQKRRVAILRALLADYDILLMDEPFKGLDLETKRQVMTYVKEMTRGKTVVFVTHDSLECDFMQDEMIYF